MDFTLTPEQEAFRNKVRSWFNANVPKDWTEALVSGPTVPRTEIYDFLREWQRKLYDAGFAGLTWPKEYGGRGLTYLEELIFDEEMVLANAPPQLNILGIAMAGPTVIALGTEEQKKRHLPKILSGEESWG